MRIDRQITIPERELEISAVRASGPGGQHRDKAATAIQLRFDFERSPSLPAAWKRGLRAMADARVTAGGLIVIRADEHRERAANERAARERLREILVAAGRRPRPRRPTRPSRRARERRRSDKRHRGRLKALRKPPAD